MDPLRNPYSPGAGAPPPELAGRESILEEARIAPGRTRAGRISLRIDPEPGTSDSGDLEADLAPLFVAIEEAAADRAAAAAICIDELQYLKEVERSAFIMAVRRVSQRSLPLILIGVKVQTVAPLRAGLIRKGMIYSPSCGDTEFTVPLFDESMKGMIPAMIS
ncbi:MAG: hypothetical protein HY014_17965 [Acidobacteria bacterium]|nr:hypothetical protein [Acidobacteriota bacterium]MBI3490023.1 hypothetical protein [Acidobacteriota bacterium]